MNKYKAQNLNFKTNSTSRVPNNKHFGFWILDFGFSLKGFTPSLENGVTRRVSTEEKTAIGISTKAGEHLFLPRPRKKATPFFSAGFTMIEMLVVVAIAAMLLSGTLVFFQQARAKARDATREQHMKTIQNALSLHATIGGRYPIYDGNLTGSDAVSTALGQSDSLSKMPRDPLSSGIYLYSYTSTDGSTYTLRYYLETDSISGKAAGLNQASP